MPNSKDSRTGWAQVSTESGLKVKLKVCVCVCALLPRDQSTPPSSVFALPSVMLLTHYLSTHGHFRIYEPEQTAKEGLI